MHIPSETPSPLFLVEIEHDIYTVSESDESMTVFVRVMRLIDGEVKNGFTVSLTCKSNDDSLKGTVGAWPAQTTFFLFFSMKFMHEQRTQTIAELIK